MEHGDNSAHFSLSAPSYASSPPRANQSPCAACKFLRRRCVQKCVLAPYFPPTNPRKFTVAHKVFGACNISKLLQGFLMYNKRSFRLNQEYFLQLARVLDRWTSSSLSTEIPEHLRADAVNSMVYEANARIRDPVYGCTGIVFHLCNQISELQEELAKALAEKSIMQSRNSLLESSFSMEVQEHSDINPQQKLPWDYTDMSFSVDYGNISMVLGDHMDFE